MSQSYVDIHNDARFLFKKLLETFHEETGSIVMGFDDETETYEVFVYFDLDEEAAVASTIVKVLASCGFPVDEKGARLYGICGYPPFVDDFVFMKGPVAPSAHRRMELTSKARKIVPTFSC